MLNPAFSQAVDLNRKLNPPSADRAGLNWNSLLRLHIQTIGRTPEFERIGSDMSGCRHPCANQTVSIGENNPMHLSSGKGYHPGPNEDRNPTRIPHGGTFDTLSPTNGRITKVTK